MSECVADVELSFIFISCNVNDHDKEEDDDDDIDIENNKKPKDSSRKKYGEKIFWTKVNISIRDIINNSKGDELRYILFKAKTKFE